MTSIAKDMASKSQCGENLEILTVDRQDFENAYDAAIHTNAYGAAIHHVKTILGTLIKKKLQGKEDETRDETREPTIIDKLITNMKWVKKSTQFVLAYKDDLLVGRTGTQQGNTFVEFTGTDILKSYQGCHICKPLVSTALESRVQDRVYMICYSKMIGAPYCYCKAALANGFRVFIIYSSEPAKTITIIFEIKEIPDDRSSMITDPPSMEFTKTFDRENIVNEEVWEGYWMNLLFVPKGEDITPNGYKLFKEVTSADGKKSRIEVEKDAQTGREPASWDFAAPATAPATAPASKSAKESPPRTPKRSNSEQPVQLTPSGLRQSPSPYRSDYDTVCSYSPHSPDYPPHTPPSNDTTTAETKVNHAKSPSTRNNTSFFFEESSDSPKHNEALIDHAKQVRSKNFIMTAKMGTPQKPTYRRVRGFFSSESDSSESDSSDDSDSDDSGLLRSPSSRNRLQMQQDGSNPETKSSDDEEWDDPLASQNANSNGTRLSFRFRF